MQPASPSKPSMNMHPLSPPKPPMNISYQHLTIKSLKFKLGHECKNDEIYNQIFGVLVGTIDKISYDKNYINFIINDGTGIFEFKIYNSNIKYNLLRFVLCIHLLYAIFYVLILLLVLTNITKLLEL